MQPFFTKLARLYSDFSIRNSAQIEPASAGEPDEIFCCWLSGDSNNVVFDAIFYPSWVELQDSEDDSHIGIIKDTDVRSAKELGVKLNQLLR